MKVTCNIIKDILPLYVENMISDDSRAMVEEHIEHCQECQASLNEMKSTNILPKDTNTSPLLKIQSKLRKKKVQIALLSAMLSLVIFVITMAFLTAPEYIPHSEGNIVIEELDNGILIVKFKDPVNDFIISSYPTDDNSGYIYHISAWDTIWNKNIQKNYTDDTILNRIGENVVSIYYYQADGSSKDILIYGKDLNPGGGVITLPRLSLTYYSIIAIVLLIICGLAMFIFRNKRKSFNFLIKISLLPFSYLLAQLIIKGFVTSSYNVERDFYAILLAMIFLFIIFLVTINYIKNFRNKRHDLFDDK